MHNIKKCKKLFLLLSDTCRTQHYGHKQGLNEITVQAAQQSTLGSAPESSSERFPFFVIFCCHKLATYTQIDAHHVWSLSLVR